MIKVLKSQADRLTAKPMFADPGKAPSEPKGSVKVTCVIPAYHAAKSVLAVVEGVLPYVDDVIVVDDGCCEGSGTAVEQVYRGSERVSVLHRMTNGGVGAAMKDGIALALERNSKIIVKIDADGQMDPSFIPDIRRLFAENPELACIKGNRFFDVGVLESMPKARFFGNAVLSLLIKGASGYWNALDPTNGYLAFNADRLRGLNWQSFSNTYFFEMSVLCELGVKRLPIAEVAMPTIYTEAPSSLSIRRVIREFPAKLFRLTLRRILIQYLIFDVNPGSLYLMLGAMLTFFGLAFGGYEWIESIVTHVARTTGTVMLAVLPFLMGFQLLLNALMYDVQFSQRTLQQLQMPNSNRRLDD